MSDHTPDSAPDDSNSDSASEDPWRVAASVTTSYSFPGRPVPKLQCPVCGNGVELDSDALEDLGDDDDAAKDLADETDFFIAEQSLMQDIGRYLGTILGPRGKMPTPLDPDDDVVEVVNRMKNTVQIRSKERRTFHTRVGAEDMDAENIASNIDVILRRLHAELEKGPLNIDSVYVKTTMGPAVEVA